MQAMSKHHIYSLNVIAIGKQFSSEKVWWTHTIGCDYSICPFLLFKSVSFERTWCCKIDFPGSQEDSNTPYAQHFPKKDIFSKMYWYSQRQYHSPHLSPFM